MARESCRSMREFAGTDVDAALQDTSHWYKLGRRVFPPGMPALFLDRDGVLIEDVNYIKSANRVRVLEGAAETIRAFRRAGYIIVVVTNQSGVARGYLNHRQYWEIEDRIYSLLGEDTPDATFACPFHPEGRPPFNIDHGWRKPSPGMFLTAAKLLDIDLSRSIMVGDRLSDLQAGRAAGVADIFHVLTGHGESERPAVQNYSALLQCQQEKINLHFIDGIGDVKVHYDW